MEKWCLLPDEKVETAEIVSVFLCISLHWDIQKKREQREICINQKKEKTA